MQERNGEMQDEREQRSGQNAEQSADHAKGDGLKRELQQDVCFCGADCFAHADLPGAFGDADQHDVHDAHAAHDQADRGDGNHEEKQAAGKLVPQASERVGAEEREVVVLLNGEFAAYAKALADFLGDQRLVGGVVVLDHDPIVQDLRMDLAEGLEREVGRVVLRIAAASERLFLLVEHADDGEHITARIRLLLAEGRFARKELFSGIVAEDGYVGAALFLVLGPHAAFDQVYVGRLQ